MCLATCVYWAQLFEGRLALNPGLNLTQVSFSHVQKHFLADSFLCNSWNFQSSTCRQKELKLKCFISFQKSELKSRLNPGLS